LDPRSCPDTVKNGKSASLGGNETLFLNIAACNLVSVLNELNLSFLLFKININLILTITFSIDWNKAVDLIRTKSVMLTEANKKWRYALLLE
jgi:hypothetical protein